MCIRDSVCTVSSAVVTEANAQLTRGVATNTGGCVSGCKRLGMQIPVDVFPTMDAVRFIAVFVEGGMGFRKVGVEADA